MLQFPSFLKVIFYLLIFFFQESKVILYLNFTKSTTDILTRNRFPRIVYVKQQTGIVCIIFSIKYVSSFILTIFVVIVPSFGNLSKNRCCSILSYVGERMSTLSLLDRATIMSPGATMGFFPIDHVTLQHLKLIGQFSINGHGLFFGGQPLLSLIFLCFIVSLSLSLSHTHTYGLVSII